jgi:hypothetical protein
VQMATHGPNLISILVILSIFVKGVSKHWWEQKSACKG